MLKRNLVCIAILAVCGGGAYGAINSAVTTDSATTLSTEFASDQSRAEKGNAAAQYSLAVCYEAGLGVTVNNELAIDWYRKAADQGNVSAQYTLAWHYMDGDGVPSDSTEAIRWYRKAAEQGHEPAKLWLRKYDAADPVLKASMTTSITNDLTSKRLRAEKGDATAQRELALCYRRGLGVPKDIEAALGWFLKSAEQGNAAAQFSLGYIYLSFASLMPEYKKDAAKWHLMAAEQGHADAQFWIGQSYKNGDGVIKNEAEAAKWYRKSAEQGNKIAQICLGACYVKGEGVVKDKTEALKWFDRAAAQGDPSTLYSIGSSFDRGKDELEAIKWYRKAAERDDRSALHELGQRFFYGRGVSIDKKEAAEWFRKAAIQGDETAKYFLGRCFWDLSMSYEEGKGAPLDKVEAAKWLRKAAEQDMAVAQYFVGVSYSKGDGVPEDKAEAVKWYRRAAEQKMGLAQCGLGVCYSNGEGVNKDKAEAVKWYRKAADRGVATAQHNLGVCYANGEGVMEDFVEAYKWFLLAGASGSEGAGVERIKLAKRMSPDQIAEAQRQGKIILEGEKGHTGIAEQPKQKESASCKTSGTGYFIATNGYILTASHVISGASRIEIRTRAGDLKAKVVQADPANDIAVLKVEGSFPAIPLENSKTVKLGDAVLTIGFPNIQIQGFSPKLTKGEISSLFGLRDDPRHFQVSAPIQPGNSGGPLLNASGNVIGTLSARLSDSKTYDLTGMLPQNVNYALKSSYALAMIEAMPEVSEKLPKPVQGARKPDDIVRAVEDAIVMILVY